MPGERLRACRSANYNGFDSLVETLRPDIFNSPFYHLDFGLYCGDSRNTQQDRNIAFSLSMQRQVAIITGAAAGLGLELAIRTCQRGFTVVGVSRRIPDEPRWEKLRAQGCAEHVSGDVADVRSVEAAFETATNRGELTAVFNCAGAGVFGPVGSYTRDDVDEALRGNLIGTIIFSDWAFREFRNAGGAIINVISTAAHSGRANETVYCASKWGARGYTEALRAEAKGTRVRVIAVYPGGMKTSFWLQARGTQVK